MPTSSGNLFRRLLPVFTGIGVIALWYAVRWAMTEEQRFLLPAPGEVIGAFRANGPALWSAARNTLLGAFAGFTSATGLSFALALVLSLSPLVRSSFSGSRIQLCTRSARGRKLHNTNRPGSRRVFRFLVDSRSRPDTKSAWTY